MFCLLTVQPGLALPAIRAQVWKLHIVLANFVQNIQNVVFHAPLPSQPVQILRVHLLLLLFPLVQIVLADYLGWKGQLLGHVYQNAPQKLQRQAAADFDYDPTSLDWRGVMTYSALASTQLFPWNRIKSYFDFRATHRLISLPCPCLVIGFQGESTRQTEKTLDMSSLRLIEFRIISKWPYLFAIKKLKHCIDTNKWSNKNEVNFLLQL